VLFGALTLCFLPAITLIDARKLDEQRVIDSYQRES